MNFTDDMECEFNNIIDLDKYLNIDLEKYNDNMQKECFELLRELEINFDEFE